MSVVGFDIGNSSAYVAVARQGGVETVANEYSERATPTCVSLGEKNRFIGTSAKTQLVTNFKNSLWGWMPFLGKQFKDEKVQELLSRLPFDADEQNDGTIGFKVRYLEEKRVFTPDQLTAMMLTKLKEVGESNLKTKVVDCVLSVPCFYTEIERTSLLNAANVAGLNVLRLMNGTTATALSYGIYKQDLPAKEENSRLVVFVDVGFTSTQVSLCAFNKGKLTVKSTSADPYLGGSNFDFLLAEYFSDELRAKYKIDVRSHPKAYMRLLQESEKLKKLMSANSQEMTLNIECFIDEKDVSCKIKREMLEEMSKDLLHRLECLFNDLIATSDLKTENLYAVEIVGGSTRVPAIKSLIKKVFGKDPSTTLNADEAVSRGCALQCAILSPTFRVRDFEIVDCLHYPMKLSWKNTYNNEDPEDMELSPRFASFPFTKMLSFYRSKPFSLEVSYSCRDLPQYKLHIGTYLIDKVVPTSSGEKSKIKVKAKMNIHGLFSISSASMVEKVETPEESEPMEVDKSNAAGEAAKEGSEIPKPETESEIPMEQQESEEKQEKQEVNPAESPDNIKKNNVKKQKTKSIDLPIQLPPHKLNQSKIEKLIELENDMIMQDKLEKERVDAKNAVEEYVYEMRDKLSASYEPYIKPQDKDAFLSLLNDVENWLYEDGENEKRQVYIDKLASLTKIGNPVRERFNEGQTRSDAFEKLSQSIQLIEKKVASYYNKDEQLAHIEASEIEKITKMLKEKQAWFEKHNNMCRAMDNSEPPPVLTKQIIAQFESLFSLCNQVLSKPKPKPKEEPPKESKNKKTDNKESSPKNKEENKEKNKSNNNNEVQEDDNKKEDAVKPQEMKSGEEKKAEGDGDGVDNVDKGKDASSPPSSHALNPEMELD